MWSNFSCKFVIPKSVTLISYEGKWQALSLIWNFTDGRFQEGKKKISVLRVLDFMKQFLEVQINPDALNTNPKGHSIQNLGFLDLKKLLLEVHVDLDTMDTDLERAKRLNEVAKPDLRDIKVYISMNNVFIQLVFWTAGGGFYSWKSWSLSRVSALLEYQRSNQIWSHSG